MCDYPRLRKRRYRVNGEAEYVDWDKLEKRTAALKVRARRALVEEAGLAPERFAHGHGSPAPYAVLTKLVGG